MLGDPGEPVRATADGTVTTAGWSGGYGKVVDIDHGNGISTRYAHLSSIDVQVGQTVKIGQMVGKVGSTGRSTGPHLHYETRVARRGGRSAEIPARGSEGSTAACKLASAKGLTRSENFW